MSSTWMFDSIKSNIQVENIQTWHCLYPDICSTLSPIQFRLIHMFSILMPGNWWQEVDGRKQIAGNRWQEAGGRKQVAGSRWQEAGGRKHQVVKVVKVVEPPGIYHLTSSQAGCLFSNRHLLSSPGPSPNPSSESSWIISPFWWMLSLPSSLLVFIWMTLP